MFCASQLMSSKSKHLLEKSRVNFIIINFVHKVDIALPYFWTKVCIVANVDLYFGKDFPNN